MKTEKEIKKIRDDLYQSVVNMRKNHESAWPMVMSHVRLLDYVLNEKDNMDFSLTLLSLKQLDWDSALAGVVLSK